MVFVVILLALAIVILVFALFMVRQQTNVVIERFGKFHTVKLPGLRALVPLIDRKAGVIDLRINEISETVNTKTSDNVFVDITVAVQFQVNPARVADAFYQLGQPRQQIGSYVLDSIRSSAAGITIDNIFLEKDEIARQVGEHVSEHMNNYGYTIIRALIVNIEPANNVRDAMNKINAAERERSAAQALAEADKIKMVVEAEGKAEAQRLQGVGFAQQRKEIVEGFRDSYVSLKESGVPEEEIFEAILYMQMLDTYVSLGQKGANTVFLNSPDKNGFLDSIRNGILAANTAEVKDTASSNMTAQGSARRGKASPGVGQS